MAASIRESGVSNSQLPTVLAYGHYGPGTYDSSTESWLFLRNNQDSRSKYNNQPHDIDQNNFKLVQKPIAYQPAEYLNETATNEKVDKCSSIKIIQKQLPHLCAANESVASQGQENEPGRNDLVGDKIAFGSALVFGDNDKQSGIILIPITVSVHGPAHDQIVLSCLGRQQLSTKDELDNTLLVDIPHISNDDIAVWALRGVVSHITVSPRTSSHRDSRCAVVTSTGTTIFHPLFRRSNALQPLTANPIIEIPYSCTGGAPHAYAMFHSHSSNVIAIIDIDGNWSTWTIRGRNSSSAKVTQHARLLTSGYVPDSSDHQSGLPKMPYPIGWHRICWLGLKEDSIDCILICNRRALYIFDIASKMLSPVKLNYVKESSSDSILDLIRMTTSNSEVLVLTKRHVMWLSVKSQSHDDVAHRLSLGTIMICNHFRGGLDQTLSLHTLECHEVVWIMLCSLATKVVTVYKACRNPTSGITITQPFFLLLPFTKVHDQCSILFRTVEADVRRMKSATSKPWLFKLLMRPPNAAVEEATYQICSDPIVRKDSSNTERISLPNLRAQYRRSAPILDLNELDDFIVGDNVAHLVHYSKRQLPNDAASSPRYTHQRAQADTICDLSVTYNAILTAITEQGSSSHANLDVYVSALMEAILETVEVQPYQSLAELSVRTPYVAEIEDDSETMTQFVNTVRALAEESSQNDVPSLKQLGQEDLMTRYEQLVQIWVVPLSQSVPDRTRIFRERLVRQTAFRMHLANILVKRQNAIIKKDKHTGPPQPDANATSTDLSTDRRGLGDISSSHSNNQIASTPGTDFVSTTPLLLSYVQFSRELPDRKYEDATMEILAHLPDSIDQDPEDYNHTAVELELSSARQEQMHQGLDPRAKRRAERLAKSRKRQLEKQEQVKKIAFDTRSQIPLITSNQLPIREVQSSQAQPASSSQTEFTGVPRVQMSQPERGQFGGRAIRKGKNKAARRAGF